MKFRLTVASLIISLFVGAASAKASTIFDGFTFYDAGNVVLATGSFSYDSSLTGTLSYANLSSFNIDVAGQLYDLDFVKSLNPANDYIYFGYDVATNKFNQSLVQGFQGPALGLMAAVDATGSIGFFIDPLPVSGCDAAVCDGAVIAYSPYTGAGNIASKVIVASIPEPSTWAMMLIGLAGICFLTLRRSRRLAFGG